jgi:DHA1 family L-arabinose/isopropyl-beta-D-thiogalactopyranoside export protein-like MFS transporter/DHA1 family inner membrane transport protein
VTTESLPIGLLTSMAEDLKHSVSAIGLLVTGYAIVVVIVSVPLTHLTRRLSRRTVLSGMLATLVVMALASALAHSYSLLFAARLVTALAQALFWSVVTSAVAGLFPEPARGRALSLMFTGTALAPVLGVPLGTWLGQRSGWRSAFVALSVLALLTFAAVVTLLPRAGAPGGEVTYGAIPDRRRYVVVLVVTTLGIAGSLTAFTYVTPFLLEVSHVTKGALALCLGISGAAGVVGSLASGPFLGRHAPGVVLSSLAAQSGALLTLYFFGDGKVLAVAMLGIVGGATASMAAGLSARGLQIAPRRTDIAAAGISSAYNLGIAGGSWVGGLVLTGFSVRATALTAALLVLASLVVAFAEPLIARRRVLVLPETRLLEDARKPAP